MSRETFWADPLTQTLRKYYKCLEVDLEKERIRKKSKVP